MIGTVLMRLFFIAVALGACCSANAGELLTPDNFGTRFNDVMRRLDIHYRAGKTECREQVARVCAYAFNSIFFSVKSPNGGKGFDYVTVICAKDCQPEDFMITIGAILRVVAPGLPASRYGEWLPLIKQVAANPGASQSIEIGRAEVSISANATTGFVASVSIKGAH